jgi:hypothetical protein
MIDPSAVIPFLPFVLKVRAGPSSDHVNHSLEGWVCEVFLLWWWGVVGVGLDDVAVEVVALTFLGVEGTVAMERDWGFCCWG